MVGQRVFTNTFDPNILLILKHKMIFIRDILWSKERYIIAAE